jgi:site-specific recombinase XerD
MTFVGIAMPAELRLVARAHVLASRKDLEWRELAGATVRRKLATLSSLFEYLSEANAVTHNPVNGVKRPSVESYEGKTLTLGDPQTRHLLKLPAGEGLQQLRDRALLSVLFHHGLRREEVCSLAHGRRFGAPWLECVPNQVCRQVPRKPLIFHKIAHDLDYL